MSNYIQNDQSSFRHISMGDKSFGKTPITANKMCTTISREMNFQGEKIEADLVLQSYFCAFSMRIPVPVQSTFNHTQNDKISCRIRIGCKSFDETPFATNEMCSTILREMNFQGVIIGALTWSYNRTFMHFQCEYQYLFNPCPTISKLIKVVFVILV